MTDGSKCAISQEASGFEWQEMWVDDARHLMQVDNLSLYRGDRLLLTGLSLTLAAGECLRLTGPNGIGKSSLIRCMAGLLQPLSGCISCDTPMALVDERLPLDRERPLARALADWRSSEADAGVCEQVMADYDLSNLAQIPVYMLSTGQRKRAALAVMMLTQARIWLMDEPGNGLDERSQELLGQSMQRHLDGGGGIVAASHGPLPMVMARSIALQEYSA